MPLFLPTIMQLVKKKLFNLFGVLSLEQALSAFCIGGIYYFWLKSVPNFKFGLRDFTMFLNLNFESYSQISDTINQEKVKFNVINFGVEI